MTKIGIGWPSPSYKLDVVGNYALSKLNKFDRFVVKVVMWYFRKKGYSVTISKFVERYYPTQNLHVSGSNTIVQPTDRMVITETRNFGIGIDEIFSNGNIGI
jgi:hypothetical protein